MNFFFDVLIMCASDDRQYLVACWKALLDGKPMPPASPSALGRGKRGRERPSRLRDTSSEGSSDEESKKKVRGL
mgnify:CR=1 FL=1